MLMMRIRQSTIGLLALVTVLFGLPVAGQSVKVVDLRCEYLKDPLGIDVVRPRLSWRLEATDPAGHGQRQTEYHILVASTAQRLDAGQGDIWDSGAVAGSQTAMIRYNGKALQSRDRCFWKVQVKDEQGKLSAWSEAGKWSLGLIAAADWTGKWIGSDILFSPAPDKDRFKMNCNVPDPFLRKVFELPSRAVRAEVSVASVGYHELYVNGQLASDAVLSPAVTDHTRRARYVTYDIASRLKPGGNVIGLWLGSGWSVYSQYKTPDRPQTPIVNAVADVELENGRSVRIATDETWVTRRSPNQLLGVYDFMRFGGELYDANLEVPGWADLLPPQDEKAWKQATVYSPKLELSAEMVEPNRRIRQIQAKAVELGADGAWSVDMGTNFAGFVEIDVTGQPGDRIDFGFSESPRVWNTHSLRSAYIVGPSGKGTFANRFNYSVGRWVNIRGLKNRPELSSVRGWLVRTDYRRASTFECSDERLNRINNAVLWTFENLSLGGYVVDCPHRERMGYGGDGHATVEMSLDNYHLGAFYTKWSQDWRDVQGRGATWGSVTTTNKPDEALKALEGNLPYTAPTRWGGGGPGWSGFCVTMPWQVYLRYGDTGILEDNFETMRKWLAFLETRSKDNMMVRWGGEWDFLGDWLWPGAKGVNGDTRETLFFNNCYWIYNLQTAAQVAEVIGQKEMAGKWRARADEVRRAVHATFFNPVDSSYVNGFQAYLAVALLVDLPPKEVRAGVEKRLEREIREVRGGHFHAGITGGYFVIRYLASAGRDDLLHLMATAPGYPGWLDMLDRGATTLWESWEGDKSLLHSSYLHIGLWFIERLGGIQPDPASPGYESFVIRPGALAGNGLEWVKATKETMHGRIVSEWKLVGRKVQVRVVVPPNTRARVVLPAGERVLEAGEHNVEYER